MEGAEASERPHCVREALGTKEGKGTPSLGLECPVSTISQAPTPPPIRPEKKTMVIGNFVFRWLNPHPEMPLRVLRGFAPSGQLFWSTIRSLLATELLWMGGIPRNSVTQHKHTSSAELDDVWHAFRVQRLVSMTSGAPTTAGWTVPCRDFSGRIAVRSGGISLVCLVTET